MGSINIRSLFACLSTEPSVDLSYIKFSMIKISGMTRSKPPPVGEGEKLCNAEYTWFYHLNPISKAFKLVWIVLLHVVLKELN